MLISFLPRRDLQRDFSRYLLSLEYDSFYIIHHAFLFVKSFLQISYNRNNFSEDFTAIHDYRLHRGIFGL